MNDKNAACVCKCQDKCICSPEESEACEEEMKILEARRVSISKDITSIKNEPSKKESQEPQCEMSCAKPQSNSCPPKEAEAMNKGTRNAQRICNSPNPINSCMKSQEKEPNKPQNSVNSLTAVNSEYSGDEWDRFGLFIAAECKSMSKENARNFKKKCLELILEHQ